MGVHEYEASLVIRSRAGLLISASAEPRWVDGYAAVQANMSAALKLMAEALVNF